jgi:ankyrin repeat protein
MIVALINAGADVNAEDGAGNTPLMLAASQSSDPDMITALIRAGADVNQKNSTNGLRPLMLAAMENGTPAIISALIEAGADVNATDDKDETALDRARESRNSRVLTILVKARAARK